MISGVCRGENTMKRWIPYVLTVWFSLLVTACGDDADDSTKPDDTSQSPVVSTSPAGKATDVERDAVVSASFREDMDSLTINDTTFTVSYNPLVSGTVAYDNSTRTATFTPDSLLDYETTYTATLTTGITNSAGSPLESDFSWSFTTKIIPGRGSVYLPRTGQSSIYAFGDDGDIRSGVEWPLPRFVDNMDGTITDQLTVNLGTTCLGMLQFLKDDNSSTSSDTESITVLIKGPTGLLGCFIVRS